MSNASSGSSSVNVTPSTLRGGPELKLVKLADEMRGDPHLVKKHTHLLVAHKNTMAGKDAISWLVEKGHAKTRASAMILCQDLMNADLIRPEKEKEKDKDKDKEFRDDGTLYRFPGEDNLVSSSTSKIFGIAKVASRRPSMAPDPLQTLFSAIELGNTERLISILNPIDSKQLLKMECDGELALHKAISKDSFLVTDILIKEFEKLGLDFNMQDKNGWTPLHCAAKNKGGSPDSDAVLRCLLSIPQVRADIPNEDGNLPLHFFVESFCSSSSSELGEMLIKKAPDSVNRSNSYGETPLHKAIFNNSTRLLMVKLLIKHGADVNLTTNLKLTALHYSVEMRRKDLIKILLQAGADTTMKGGKLSQTPSEVAHVQKLDEILELFKQVEELYDFLKSLKMEEMVLEFQKQQCYLDVLLSVSSEDLESLMTNLHVEALGTRIKFKKACEELREKRVAKKKTGKSIYQPGELKKLKTNNINHSDLEFTKEIGSGAYGKVFKGLYKSTKVAIKVLTKLDNNTGFKEFQQECEILGALNHPNIVNFLGACFQPQTCIVLEYCPMGSLTSYMQKEEKFDWKKGLHIVRGSCNGLLALHTRDPPIFHRDIKSDNILINEFFEAKLSDMGLARFFEEGAATFDRMVGTFAYLAPERYHGSSYTAKSDIYSMGIVLWEIAFRACNKAYQRPFGEFPNLKPDFKIALHAAEKNLRPTIPSILNSKFKDLIVQCWDADPEKRPSAKQLYTQVVDLQEDLEDNPENWGLNEN